MVLPIRLLLFYAAMRKLFTANNRLISAKHLISGQ